MGEVMPIPTPAPPVKDFDENDLTIARAIIHQLAHDSVEGLNLPGVARLFDRMAALLLQRAQEIAELETRIAELEGRRMQFPAHCETPFKSPETPAEHEMVRKYWENY
jgi:BMFP domain-containing protein YqiC